MTYKNGHNSNDDDGDNKIIVLPTLAERDKARKLQDQKNHLVSNQPMINIPPFTKYMLALIIGIYFITDIVLTANQSDWLSMQFGFISQKFQMGHLDIFSILSPLSHTLLHGSWMHVMMNALMLAAFGSGVEKWLGFNKIIFLFFFSAFFGALAHFILNTGSPYPMIGASGGISGLFAAGIVMLGKGQREMGGKFGILPFALIWIGLSIAFGMMGGPDGSIIAWAAHVGGFLGGFLALKILKA